MFNGQWSDPSTPQEQPVRVSVQDQGLRVERLGGSSELWPYAEVEQAKRRRGQPLRFERGNPGAPPTASIAFADSAILIALQQHAAPEWRRKFDNPVQDKKTRKRTWQAVVTIAGLWIVYTLALPLLGEAVTRVVPVSWEEALGEAVAKNLVPEGRRCTDPALQSAVEGLVDRLVVASGDTRYRFRTAVLDDPMVNAFAAPGGYVVVARGLLRQMRSPEELAGVLAHEIEHVRQRHATRSLVRKLSVQLVIGLLVGDAAALGGAVGLASNLNQLRFSRGDESSADREGLITLTRAGIPAHHMANALERLKSTDDLPAPSALTIFSTHPEMDERVANLRATQKKFFVDGSPITLAMPWNELTQRCR